jgi:hypothetical protein
MVTVLHPLLAVNVGFAISFGIFVVALLTLFFLTARWAIRHDRAGFKEWRQRQRAAAPPTATPTPTPSPTPSPGEGDAPPTTGA